MLKQVPRNFAHRHGILRKLNYSRKIHINGVEISVPSIRGITCNVVEPWMTDLLDKVLPEQRGAFLDVGVNVGQTLVQVKALDQHRKYIGFEPNPICAFYAQELIKENKFENCTILPIGLFTEDCVLPLDLFSDNEADSSASLIDNFRPDHKIHSRFFVLIV